MKDHDDSEHAVCLNHAEPGGESQDRSSPDYGVRGQRSALGVFQSNLCPIESETMSPEALCQPLKKVASKTQLKNWNGRSKREGIEKEGKEKEPSDREG